MKKISILLILVLSILYFGCSENNSMVQADQSNKQLTWLEKPSQVNSKYNNSVEAIYEESEVVIGLFGDIIRFDFNYDENPDNGYLIKGKLRVPHFAFWGVEEIKMTFDDHSTTVNFSPDGAVFYRPLRLTLQYTELDLTNVNPNDIEFCYQSANGEIIPVEYSRLLVNKREGWVKVINAKIEHFSRYGFTK